VADPQLDVRVDTSLPETLPPGCATAIFVLGSCFHRCLPVRRTEVVVDGVATEVDAEGMPRLDLYRSLHPYTNSSRGEDHDEGDPHLHSYRSGFWATVPIEAPRSGEIEVAIRATLSDGTRAEASLGTIQVVDDGRPEPVPSQRETAAGARVAIAMATFDPDIDLLRDQVESIRAQTMTDWICVISDDCSPPDTFERMRSVIEDDERFVLTRSERRLGFYRNFERALELVPGSVPYVALADQDDRWYPDKLQTLLDEIGDAQLIYSDQRVVDTSGQVLADSYWTDRRNNYTNLASLLIANTVTGAASLFRREVLDLALPFPETPGVQYHDHWLGLVALSSGRIAYVDRPLYEYVQHEGAALGHVAATAGVTRNPRVLLARLRRGEWSRLTSGSRVAYFHAYCRLRLLAEVLLSRCGRRMKRGSRAMLQRVIRSERSPVGLAWLAARGASHWLGRDTATLGAESLLLRGIAWRYAVRGLAAGRRRPLPRVPYDASLPQPTEGVGVSAIDHPMTHALGQLFRPLQLSVSAQAPVRTNLLLPTIELRHLFGGYITKFNLARKLAERGARVRIVTVDPTPSLPRSWREQVESYAGLRGLFDQVEVAFGRDHDSPLEVNPDDAFVATTWWTAHIAHAALRSLNRTRFLYLIQEYEPYTHPMGSWAAMARSTYELPHVALFSTELLRDFFAARGYGVFAAGEEEGRRTSLAFQNAITAVSPPTAEEMARQERKRVLFYARPESHGARNMFELGLLGLADAISRNAFGPEWDFLGIGSVEGHDRIRLGTSTELEVLPRRGQGSYAELLASCDVGLALMCTPHPSLVPLEMASAGMLTVTNSFETKTPEAMSSIAANLITVPPSLDGVAGGLQRAAAGVHDYARRIDGATVDWSRDWEQSLNPDVMRRVNSMLDSC
jgi:glycosyltransferase involved in cell wall biosynthesis